MTLTQRAREALYTLRVRLFGRLAVEAATEGRTALYAVDQDTPEGDIQVARQRADWVTQIARHVDILEQGQLTPKQRHDTELLVRQLRRNVRDLDAAEARRHATPQGLGNLRLSTFGAVGRPRGLLGPLAASPALAILLSPWTWLVASLALVGIQTARIGNLKDDVREARGETQQAVEERDAWKERAEQYAQAVADARQIATETADALEAERAARARAAARERRRQREIQDVLTGSPEPPAWSLRDDEYVPPGPSAGN